MAVELDPILLEVLACPAPDHAALRVGAPDDAEADALTCTECGRVYPVRDGIPVLLLDEATGGPDDSDAPPPALQTPSPEDDVAHEPGIDVLTDPDELLRADRAGLLLAVARAGAQLRSTAERTTALPADAPRGVLVAGPTAVRDTALLCALAGPGPAPWTTLELTGADAPELPPWVGALDLVVVLAGHRDDPAAAEITAQARFRGAALVVRGAESGPVADAAGRALIGPGIPTPEFLALPGRLALLLRVAAAAGQMPTVDLDAVAAALDAEALACGPAAESFTNPAFALAQGLWAMSPLFLGSDQVGRALAAHGAGSLGLLAGVPAAAESGSTALRAPQLLARLGRPRDPFADPFLDPAEESAPAVPVLIAPGPGAGEAALATHRALERVFPRALLVADDGDDGRTDDLIAARLDPDRASSLLTSRVAAALRAAVRIDYAAVYLGIAAGQVAPADAPEGLGPAGSVQPPARPATVEGVTGDRRSDMADTAETADPWDETAWN